MPPCYSTCKKLNRIDCDGTRKCSYIDGNKRKYCRLSSKYVMKPPKCTVFKKTKKKSSILEQGVDTAKNVIGKFIFRKKDKIRHHYLKTVCSDSGVCIAFGKNSKIIMNFFDDFINFKYATSLIPIGAESANGFVNEVGYTRDNYHAYAVLKSNNSRTNDNLVYEYLVGKFINDQTKYFPCFVETYGLYYYNDPQSWRTIKDNHRLRQPMDVSILKNSLTYQEDAYDYEKMCRDSKFACILIQHLKGARTIADMTSNPDFVANQLLYVLYQVYLPLAIHMENFTHYDLHNSNVLLYEPIPGKHITYHYHMTNRTITFNSPYIAKIIDYGRCFFKDHTGPNQIREKLCLEPQCREGVTDCGDAFGFNYLNDDPPVGQYFINSIRPNKSHDLRLLDILSRDRDVAASAPQLSNVLKHVVYGQGLDYLDANYGTEPRNSDGRHINNVVDAEEILRHLILRPDEQTKNANVVTEKLGDLHIYVDVETPMHFE